MEWSGVGWSGAERSRRDGSGGSRVEYRMSVRAYGSVKRSIDKVFWN